MEFLSMKLVVQTSFGLEFDIVPSGVHVVLESSCILVLSGKFYYLIYSTEMQAFVVVLKFLLI